jgi:N-acetylmuramoyl-L-alanine amidase
MKFAQKYLLYTYIMPFKVRNIILLFTAFGLMMMSFTTLETHQFKVKTIVIDAGHGGKDPGCLGVSHREAHIALDVALELGRIIEENLKDVKVIYTRNTNKFIELHDRAGIANKNNADLFISIHCNSNDNKSVHGSETYTMGLEKSKESLEVAKRENEVILKEENYLEKYDGFDPNSPIGHILFANYKNAFMESSLKFADKVEREFETKVGRKSRGVKQANFLVLWKTTMPSSLIEIGYLSNPSEEKFMSDKQNQVYIASAIYRALKEYKTEIESMN